MLPLPAGSSWAQAPGVYVVSGVSGAFWDARGGLEMPVAGIYQMEKLGISHQVAKNSPCFVYFALFFTSLGPFSAGYTLGFSPLQKCKVLGG